MIQPTQRTPALWAVALALLGAGTLDGAHAAQDAQKPNIDPDARALLGEVAAVYRDSNGFWAEGAIIFRARSGDATREDPRPVTLGLDRPAKLVLAIEGSTLSSDGESLVAAVGPLRKFYRQPAPKILRGADILVSPLGSIIAGGPVENPLLTLLTLLLEKDAPAALLDGASSLTLEQPAQEKSRILTFKRSPRPDLRLTVNPQTKTVTRIEVVLDPARLEATSVPGATIHELSAIYDLDSATLAPPNDPARFAFNTPAGFSEVVVAQAKPAAAPQQHKLVGNPAPDFKFDVLDGPDKTRSLTKADLAGRVVVIDFWATWCPPCREELPEIQRLAERLGRQHAGKVMVIALSQDRAPDDGSPVRKLVESSLEELKVSLASGPVAKVGLDPNQDVGDAFGVEGIPMIVVIDPQGTVQAVHIGYREGIGEELAEQVEALLAGKPLVNPPAADAREPASR